MGEFAATFQIGGRVLGAGAPMLFIAEAGVAHFGDPDKAETLVNLAAGAGAHGNPQRNRHGLRKPAGLHVAAAPALRHPEPRFLADRDPFL